VGLKGEGAPLCQISSKLVNLLKRYCDFSRFVWHQCGPPTHKEYLVVFVVVQNLVVIDAVL